MKQLELFEWKNPSCLHDYDIDKYSPTSKICESVCNAIHLILKSFVGCSLSQKLKSEIDNCIFMRLMTFKRQEIIKEFRVDYDWSHFLIYVSLQFYGVDPVSMITIQLN